ncbi:MAG: NapC/NirT family cytochrome c [Nitrospirota bacterium]|nr:NapC/NirT family cytochrome c [Nitrospirota bacterium]
MAWLLAALAVANVALIAGMFYGWVPMGRTGRRLLGFVVLGMFPLLWGSAAFSHNFNRIKQVEFCATCHVMSEHVASLKVPDETVALAPLHYQNNFVPQETACYFCHTSYTWFGPVKGKISGIRHIWVYYFKGPPDPINLHIYDPYENRDCLRCHGKSKRWNNQPVHNMRPGLKDEILAGTKRCLDSGCHSEAHLIASEIAAAAEEDW